MRISELIEEGFELAGHFDVDAGLCWIGDPCYLLQGGRPTTVGNDWPGFCDFLEDSVDPLMKSFPHEHGGEGLGVCVSTGFGDGTYPVLIKKGYEGRIAEVRIVFISDEEDEEEEAA